MGSQLSSLMATAGTTRDAYTPDGPVAKRIASVTPYFPFKGIPKFYDIGGFLKDPEAFALVVEASTKSVISERRAAGPTILPKRVGRVSIKTT